MKLHTMTDTFRKNVKRMRVGRGKSSKGKTCGRGMKGAKARSGYKRRAGQEGGQRPVFRKIPIRGFKRGAFVDDAFAINLGIIDQHFQAGEVVNLESLRSKLFISNKKTPIIKILGNGELSKPLTFEVHATSATAEEKITKAKGTITLVQ
jgi:large subunit ribosomal protein L15